MGVDTRNKRASVIGLPWPAGRVLPHPTGTIAAAARELLAICYAALDSASNVIDFTNELFQSPSLSGESLTEAALADDSLSSPALTGEILWR